MPVFFWASGVSYWLMYGCNAFSGGLIEGRRRVAKECWKIYYLNQRDLCGTPQKTDATLKLWLSVEFV